MSGKRDHCSRCDTIPIDIMVLQCGHPLCLGCASILITSNEYIKCSQCSYPTYLQQSIIEQLQTHNTFVKNSRCQPYRSQHGDQKYEATYKKYDGYHLQETKMNGYLGTSTLKASRNINNHRYKQQQYLQTLDHQEHTQIYCKQHQQYQIIYICLTCHSQPSIHHSSNHNKCLVCPECIIHGHHHAHQVQTIKKYLTTTAKNYLHQHLHQLTQNQQALSQAASNSKNFLIAKNQQISLLKANTGKKYAQLHQQLRKQQQFVMKKCDELLDSYNREYCQIQKWVEEDKIMLMQRHRNIECLLQPIGNSANMGSKGKLVELGAINRYLQYVNKEQENGLDDLDRMKMKEYITGGESLEKRQRDYVKSMRILGQRVEGVNVYMQDADSEQNHMNGHYPLAPRQITNNTIKPNHKIANMYKQRPYPPIYNSNISLSTSEPNKQNILAISKHSATNHRQGYRCKTKQSAKSGAISQNNNKKNNKGVRNQQNFLVF